MVENGESKTVRPLKWTIAARFSESSCPKCGQPSPWHGACERCIEAFEERQHRNRYLAERYAAVTEGLFLMEWPDVRIEDVRPMLEARQPAAWEQIRTWWGKESLFLWGPTGTGKTYTAIALLNQALWNRFSIAGGAVFALLQMVSRFGCERQLARILYVDLLLLDDLDKVQWSEHTLTALQYILDQRSQAGRRVIITTNLSPAGLARNIEQASPDGNKSFVRSILTRLNPCVKVEMTGPSLRTEGERT